MHIEGIKLIFVMNFSVLDFFKFASRMPQIAQITVHRLQISNFSGERGGACPGPPQKFPLFFFMSNSRL